MTKVADNAPSAGSTLTRSGSWANPRPLKFFKRLVAVRTNVKADSEGVNHRPISATASTPTSIKIGFKVSTYSSDDGDSSSGSLNEQQLVPDSPKGRRGQAIDAFPSERQTQPRSHSAYSSHRETSSCAHAALSASSIEKNRGEAAHPQAAPFSSPFGDTSYSQPEPLGSIPPPQKLSDYVGRPLIEERGSEQENMKKRERERGQAHGYAYAGGGHASSPSLAIGPRAIQTQIPSGQAEPASRSKTPPGLITHVTRRVHQTHIMMTRLELCQELFHDVMKTVALVEPPESPPSSPSSSSSRPLTTLGRRLQTILKTMHLLLTQAISAPHTVTCAFKKEVTAGLAQLEGQVYDLLVEAMKKFLKVQQGGKGGNLGKGKIGAGGGGDRIRSERERANKGLSIILEEEEEAEVLRELLHVEREGPTAVPAPTPISTLSIVDSNADTAHELCFGSSDHHPAADSDKEEEGGSSEEYFDVYSRIHHDTSENDDHKPSTNQNNSILSAFHLDQQRVSILSLDSATCHIHGDLTD